MEKDVGEMTPEEINDRVDTAYHECGHVVACLLLDIVFTHVELDTGGGNTGSVTYLGLLEEEKSTPEGRQYTERLALLSACGPAAEERATGSYNHHGASEDWNSINVHIYSLVGYSVQLQTWHSQVESLAQQMFTKPDGVNGTRAWWKVGEIAKKLLKKGKLTKSECMDIAFGGMLPLEAVRKDFRVFPWMKL